MFNYNSVIKEIKNYNDLNIKEIVPIMKLNIRGKKKEFFTNVGKILNMILPTKANTSSSNDNLTSIWLGPDEWMIYSNNPVENNNNGYELEESLYSNISKNNLGSVSDVTDQFVMINLEGKKIFELFKNSFFIDEITEVEASMLPAIAKLFSIQESEISIVFIPEKTCVSPFTLTTMI